MATATKTEDWESIEDTSNDDAASHSTVMEKLSDSIQGKDEPIEKKHPLVPAALVFLTYPLALALTAFIMIAILWWMQTINAPLPLER